MNWGVTKEEVAVSAAANVYDTAKLYKQENISLGTANTVKLGVIDVKFGEATVHKTE